MQGTCQTKADTSGGGVSAATSAKPVRNKVAG
jgi:hypothetical protein